MRFAISVLICVILWFAGTQTQSQQDQQEIPAELSKVCSEKNLPPCATPPRAIYTPSAEYSAQARKAGYQGDCTVGIIVEADGHTSHIRMISGAGMGLDEKAMEAVKRWKFRPATKDGKPVAVAIAVKIAFRLYDRD